MVAGKFDEAKALQYIQDYFSVIPKPTRKLDEVFTVEPPQDGEKFVEVRRAGDSKNIGAMYHTASYADKDYAALDALVLILTSDPSGYLYKSLVETKMVASVWAYQPEVRDASFMYFGFDIPNEKNIETTRTSILAELNKISTIAYTQEDLNRAKAKLLKDLENKRNNTIGLAIGLTEIIGAGDYRLFFLYRDNVENLSLQDIERVAKKYFLANNRTVGTFIPSKDEVRVKSNEILNADIASMVKDYKGKAAVADAAPFEATIANLKKNYSEGKISNGLKYGIINKEIKGKKVSVSITLPVANEKDLSGKGTIGAMAAALMSAGTKSMTKEQIKDKLDALKSSVYIGFSGQNISINISTYKESYDQTMEIVRQIIEEPVFPQNELDKMIIEYVTYYESQLNDPQALAFTEISRLTSNYPKTSIFYTASFQEIIDELKAVKRDQLVAFYTNIMGANNGYATIIGMNDNTKIANSLEKVLGKWNSKSKYTKAYPTFTATKSEDKVFQIDDKENAAVVGAINLKINRYSSDYPAFVFANEILGSGGFMSARIPTRLREKEGISYGAASFVNASADPKNDVGVWMYYAFYNPTKREAVETAAKDELTKIIKDGVTEEEMKANKSSWASSRLTNLGSDSYLVGLSNSYLNLGVSFEEFDKLNAQIQQLKAAEVNAAIKKYLSLEKMTSVYTGDFKKK